MLHGALQVTLGKDVLILKTVHFADDRPFAFEERYINLETAPDARDARFKDISANEWLVHNAPYSDSDLSFFAVNADERLSRKRDAAPGTVLFSMERITWSVAVPITHVRLVYAPEYRMRTEI